MGRRLQGKTAVITGAGQGIGRAAALAFAAEGARVIATSRSEPPLATLRAEHDAIETQALDVADGAAIEAFARTLARVDVLLNCAGTVHTGTILDCSEEEWDHSFNLNVRSIYRLTKAVLPTMIRHGGGSIVNIASVAGSVKGVPRRFVYASTKAAVIGLTKAVAVDFIREGIRCNAICPGTIDTPSLNDRIAMASDPVQARAEFINRQPMGRLGRAEEIAALAVHLASDEAAFTTGAVYIADGGFTL